MWFSHYDWNIAIEYHSTEVFPDNVGLVDIQVKDFVIKVSGKARAMMECLFLVPKYQEILEMLSSHGVDE